jgi:hypothetical protein
VNGGEVWIDLDELGLITEKEAREREQRAAARMAQRPSPRPDPARQSTPRG